MHLAILTLIVAVSAEFPKFTPDWPRVTIIPKYQLPTEVLEKAYRTPGHPLHKAYEVFKDKGPIWLKKQSDFVDKYDAYNKEHNTKATVEDLMKESHPLHKDYVAFEEAKATWKKQLEGFNHVVDEYCKNLHEKEKSGESGKSEESRPKEEKPGNEGKSEEPQAKEKKSEESQLNEYPGPHLKKPETK